MGRVGPLTWNFACPDWKERLKTGASLVPPLPLDDREAERAVKMFNKLRLPDVPGQPAMAEAAGEWFRDIVRAVFGSLDEGGRRQVPEVFCLVAKKNSKTTGGAGIMVTALLMNKRPRAEFLFIGPTQDIADTAYQQASGMIEADEYLRKRFHLVEHRKTIVDRTTRAKLRIKTFDMKVMTGVKPVGVLVDELHVMSSMSGAARVLGQVRGGLLPNPESFLIFITTQSDEPPAGVFKAELEYARGVRDGTITEAQTLPILYEFPEEMQTAQDKPWRDPANWPMVLPNLGRSITLDRLTADYASARNKGDEEERRWASQHLNVEIGLALHANRWAGADYWEKRADESLTFDTLLSRSEVVVVGVDGGGLDDLFGLNVLGRCRETQHWLSWTHAWCHEGVLKRRQSIASRLRDFEKDGELTIVEDELDDVSEIAGLIKKVSDAGLLAFVAVDPMAIGELVDELAMLDITQESGLLVGVSQGIALMGAMKTVERKLANGTFRHSGSGLMAWAVSNLKIEQMATAIRATKQNAGDAKVDPAIALFNSSSFMSKNPAPKAVLDIAAMVA